MPTSDYFSVVPLELHRTLEPARLSGMGELRQRVYDAEDRELRHLRDAVVVGALRGSARSRRLLGVFASPAERFFGTDPVRRPSPTRGLVPYVFESTLALTEAVALPRLAPVVTHAILLAHGLTSRRVAGRRPADSAEQGANVMSALIKLIFFPVAVAVTLGFYTSAAAKAATAVPGAIVGAWLGVTRHLMASAQRCPSDTTAEFGARGARNEGLFASLGPVSQVPPDMFFLSEDGFGFDVRELYLWLRQTGIYLNPHTNVPFAATDFERLTAHASGLFEDATAVEPLSWAERGLYGKFVRQLSQALHQTGTLGPSARRQAAAAMRQVVTGDDRRLSARLSHFFSTVSGRSMPELLSLVETDGEAAFELGAYLELQCREYAMSRSTDLAVRFGFPWVATFDALLERSMLQWTQKYLFQRAPWVRTFYVPTPGMGNTMEVAAFDLTP